MYQEKSQCSVFSHSEELVYGTNNLLHYVPQNNPWAFKWIATVFANLPTEMCSTLESNTDTEKKAVKNTYKNRMTLFVCVLYDLA